MGELEKYMKKLEDQLEGTQVLLKEVREEQVRLAKEKNDEIVKELRRDSIRLGLEDPFDFGKKLI